LSLVLLTFKSIQLNHSLRYFTNRSILFAVGCLPLCWILTSRWKGHLPIHAHKRVKVFAGRSPPTLVHFTTRIGELFMMTARHHA